jgi:hypothetical protein
MLTYLNMMRDEENKRRDEDKKTEQEEKKAEKEEAERRRKEELDREERKLADEKAEKERKIAERAARRTQAGAQGRSSINTHLTGLGLDPSEYGGSIDDLINSVLMGISPEDENPGSYFTGITDKFVDTETGRLRSRAGRDLDKLFGSSSFATCSNAV